MGPELEPAALMERLRDDRGRRRLSQGFRTLERLRPLLAGLAALPCGGVLTGLIAQWVDAGLDQPRLLRCLLESFPKAGRAALSLVDYLNPRTIPKVWEREGRKISKVAEKLSISPKKVRRILHSARISEAYDI